VQGFGLPFLSAEGFEADDLIATFTRNAERKGYKVFDNSLL
jgi:5'-3' exonuclease